jgi:BirA family biotin operon repressor/biotin-[acetyl-CoA-carboxylase] ligase
MLLDGLSPAALATIIGVPRVVHRSSLSSTMDEAHRLAAGGAEAGTLVIAGEQTAGRGRGGRRWVSSFDAGLWMTLIERPSTPSGLDVLSLRLGLHAAPVLERFTDGRVQLKWPNDLLVGGRKLAGILVEARWRQEQVEWVAIGMGINFVVPAGPPTGRPATTVRAGTRRSDLLVVLVPALRAAAAMRGPLSEAELAAFAARDAARGRRTVRPAAGLAGGISADGALVIESGDARALFRDGSLVFDGEAE